MTKMAPRPHSAQRIRVPASIQILAFLSLSSVAAFLFSAIVGCESATQTAIRTSEPPAAAFITAPTENKLLQVPVVVTEYQ